MIEWEEIDSPLIPLRPRTYGKVESKVDVKQAEKNEGELVGVGASSEKEAAEHQAMITDEKPGGEGYAQQPVQGEGMPLDKYSGPDGGNPHAKD